MNADVAAFQTLHPDIVIKTVSVGAQCDNPPDFTARLQGGTQADVFYAYMTDLNQVLDANGAEDITSYINKDTVPNYDSILPAISNPFKDGGKTYGIGYAGYTMGLVYNKTLFKAAGITTKPPATWRDGRRREDRGARPDIAGYSSTAPAAPVAGTSPLRSTRVAARCPKDGKTATVNAPRPRVC